ncbi:MAG TPA: zf-HC2 domain-containing protein [Vicinamibacterales bacterium]|jgi:hypothetical protein|nr:zf-HC2 domain-containing protein [Vicinamibacterales bacterium]
MNGHGFELELGDYVDGTLAPDRQAAVEAHLLSCHTCRATVADFTSIRSMARTLEPHVPAAAAWTRLSASLEREHKRPAAWWRLTTGGFAWRAIAAAAVMIVLLAGGSWLAWRDAGATRTATNASTNAATHGGPTVVNADVQLAERDLTDAITSLEQVTKAQTDSLDPGTVRVVQANLEVLDQAIGQSRDALKTQPANTAAQESLFDALRSKVQLLQDVVALINEMRKGNPDGAARIISGMNP